MFRIIMFAGMTAGLIGSAAADGLPDAEIKAYCTAADVAGRTTRCSITESYAGMWIRYHQIDLRIFYQCAGLISSVGGGYLQLQACIVSKHDADI